MDPTVRYAFRSSRPSRGPLFLISSKGRRCAHDRIDAAMEAESVIRELNVAMKWLEYPGLKNGAVSANDLEFAVPGGIG